MKDRVQEKNEKISLNQEEAREEDIAVHIFSASSTMIGVCLMVIGIIHVIIDETRISTVADDLLALATLVFLCSCGLSYWALRARYFRRIVHVERVADVVFIFGLWIVTVVAFIITYSFIS
jgi:hypothetical protein